MWVQASVKSVEVVMSSEMLICEIADSCPVFSPVIQRLLFPSFSFSPSSKKFDDPIVFPALHV